MCLDAACEAIRQLSVFMLTRRAAAFAAMRPTLLFKLEYVLTRGGCWSVRFVP